MADTLHYVPMGGTGDSSNSCPSSTPWIVAIIIVFLIAVGLAIWLIILYAGGNVGGSNDRLLALPGAKIKATNNQVSGSWGTLDNENDKVTLYVSEKPFVYNTDGTITCNSSTVRCDTETGSGQTATVSVSSNTSYNAMLVVTSDETCHYRVFGPIRVFTQTTSDLSNKLFNIRDLNSCNGSVSNDAHYTTKLTDVGTFRLGSQVLNSNTSTNNFLVKYLDNDITDPDAETDQILCRKPGTNQVELSVWSNKDTPSANPIICPSGDTDCNTTTSIGLGLCQWSYNDKPDGGAGAGAVSVQGENKWCLTAAQSTSLTNTNNNEFVCLSRNGNTLATTSAGLSDTWFNSFVV